MFYELFMQPMVVVTLTVIIVWLAVGLLMDFIF